jgi:hypothetical protein
MAPNILKRHLHQLRHLIIRPQLCLKQTTPKLRIAHVLRAPHQGIVIVQIILQPVRRRDGLPRAVENLAADVDGEFVGAWYAEGDGLLEAEGAWGRGANGLCGYDVGGGEVRGCDGAEEVGEVAVGGVDDGLPGEGGEVEERVFDGV